MPSSSSMPSQAPSIKQLVLDSLKININVCNPTLERDDTGDDSDYTCGDNDIVVEPPANPDYLVNSLVDVDGGTGSDRLTIVGTEFNDRYVVQDGKIFGGGLTVKVRTKTNIEFNLIILS